VHVHVLYTGQCTHGVGNVLMVWAMYSWCGQCTHGVNNDVRCTTKHLLYKP